MIRHCPYSNPAIILIGMATAGKTFLGQRLAERLGWPFLDTDQLLAQRIGQDLPTFLATAGAQRFCQAEAETIRGLVANRGHEVLATGGSLIYSPQAVRHLRQFGYLIWLDVPLPLLLQRLQDSLPRGLVRMPHDPLDLKALIKKRNVLYRKAADLRVPLPDSSLHRSCDILIQHLTTHPYLAPCLAQSRLATTPSP